MKFSFNMEDASQVFVGAFALAVPISFSEEAWRLGFSGTSIGLLVCNKLKGSFQNEKGQLYGCPCSKSIRVKGRHDPFFTMPSATPITGRPPRDRVSNTIVQ